MSQTNGTVNGHTVRIPVSTDANGDQHTKDKDGYAVTLPSNSGAIWGLVVVVALVGFGLIGVLAGNGKGKDKATPAPVEVKTPAPVVETPKATKAEPSRSTNTKGGSHGIGGDVNIKGKGNTVINGNVTINEQHTHVHPTTTVVVEKEKTVVVERPVVVEKMKPVVVTTPTRTSSPDCEDELVKHRIRTAYWTGLVDGVAIRK